MEQSTSDSCILEGVILSLQEEKRELEGKLRCELEDSERHEIEERLTEIHKSLQVHHVEPLEPVSQVEHEVRRSERIRRPTEKMLEFRGDEIAKRERKFMFTYVNFKAEVQFTRSKLKEECSKTELGKMMVNAEKYESELKEIYENIRMLTTPSQDIRRKMDSCTSVTSDIITLLKRRQAEAETKEFDSVAAREALLHLLQREDARSIYGSTVSRARQGCEQESRASAKKVEAAAHLASKRAEIKREKEIFAQRQEVLAQQEKLKMLEAQRDLEAMEAEYSVYAEEESKFNAEIHDTGVDIPLAPRQLLMQQGDILHGEVHQDVSASLSSERKPEPKTNEASLVETLKESLALSRLPAPEPFVFSGDPLKFTEWSTCFKALIETCCTDPAHRLFYFKKYVSGEARCVLEGTFYRSDGEAYAQAWETLNKRYGHPFVVQRAFRGKLNNWPKIGPRDSLRLREFSDFLVSCKNATPHVQGLKVLDDCEENQKLLQKLPDWATSRWNRYVTKTLDEGKPYPGFAEFSDFVAEEARIARNPVSSLHALRHMDDRFGKDQKHSKASTLVTSTKVFQRANPTSRDSSTLNGPKDNLSAQMKRQIECICCHQNHFIYKCEKFAAMPLQERKKFVIENNMCFGCLRVGHVSKNCRRRATCNICRRSHPSPLHEEQSQGEKAEAPTQGEHGSTVLCSTKVDDNNSTSMIVPVWLSCANNSQETLVYALLDTQSSNTFVDEDICERVHADTVPVRLKLSTMTSKGTRVNCQRAEGLRVRGYFSQEYINLPPAYTREYIPLEQGSIPTRDTAKKWTHLLNLAEEMPDRLDCPVGLLIGYDCSRALKPKQVISGGDYKPYAVLTDLGWSIVGSKAPCAISRDVSASCHRIGVKEIPSIAPASVMRALEADFRDTNPREKKISQEDIQFLQILNGRIQTNKDGHLEMPLPFCERPQLPNNKQLATIRLRQLKRKLEKNPKYKEDYVQFMNGVFKDGDAEEADATKNKGSTWYIPHHGVYHARKPGKIRVVFDCSAKFEGTSLNDHLLTGPDLTNALIGVLCRFREHQIAIICDLEKMFHRFHVSPEDRDFLRFLWWEDGDTGREPKEYRMLVHIFGAASSPGCANYGMQYLAGTHERHYPLAAAFIRRHFYMDDGIVSVNSVEAAKQLIKEARELFTNGKLRLHKFMSNNKEVLDAVPESERASTVDRDLDYNELPMQSVLGVKWNVQTDTFLFTVIHSDRAATRRGILSMVASVFDLLGFLAPYILTGKRVLQEVCKHGIGWDDPLPPELKPTWETWLHDLKNLQELQIPRCFVPGNLGMIQRIELHHFSDASNTGYGQCSYIRILSEEQVHCALVMGKARVAPSNVVTIPRLELTAATVSAAVSNLLREELELKIDQEFFWTDSIVVLGYIKNEARRFHVFVANRVQRIRASTDPEQWFYVETSQNPADHASRGLTVAELVKSNWLTGPKFLWEREIVTDHSSPQLLMGDPEVRVLRTDVSERERFLDRFARFSDWNTALNVVARILRLAKRHLSGPISVEERRAAALALVKATQREAFEEELKWFKHKTTKLPKTHKLHQLDPILENGVLRVGGRLRRSSLSLEVKHPVILPKDGVITQLILDHCHKKIQHQGRGQTLNEIRASGYWIIGASKAVAKHIKGCVACRRMRRPAEGQRMADLPVDRIEPSPPFSYTGIDCFGPFYTKQGRKEFKRYGLLFTCLSCRAIHIEMLEDLSTDAFLNALRCFIAIRGAVRQIRSDQGSNFVGARNELSKSLMELDKERISTFLARKQCDFLLNVPDASHRGGVWERQIRSVRNAMSAVLAQATGRLDDSSLRTFFYEAMFIVNSRPLTTDTINDPKSVEPLTPNHLLTMKSTVPLPPPGVFVKEDLYARKRWRRVQYLSEQFWSRWCKEYLANICLRQQWHVPRRNVKVGDIVIIKEDNVPRCEWKLARVVETSEDDDKLVRKVKIQLGQGHLGTKGERLVRPSLLERPVQKLVVLLESNP